ncbi:hypothetical protein J3E73DRAFT_428277 [Bipolaris maydis]|nr:hypothetical protein J3E73DRAFT_428277 [Bipolaris maydis]
MTLCVLGRRNKDGTAELAGAVTRRQWGAQDGQRGLGQGKMKPEQSSTARHSAAQRRMRGRRREEACLPVQPPWVSTTAAPGGTGHARCTHAARTDHQPMYYYILPWLLLNMALAHSRHAYCIFSSSLRPFVSVSHHAGTWRCNASTSRNGEHTAQVRHRNEIWKATCTCILLRPPLSGYVAALVPACSSCCCCMHTHIGAAEQRCSDHFFLVSDAHDNIPPHLLCPILYGMRHKTSIRVHNHSEAQARLQAQETAQST